MKKPIILVLIVFSTFFCQANTDSIPIYELDAIDVLTTHHAFSGQMPLSLYQTQQARTTWLNKFVNWVTTPFRDVWGMYDEEGHRSNGPYTVFQHHKGNISEQVVAIRQKILAKDPAYFTLYAEIYKLAKNGSTDNCTDKESTCPSSQTAKCAAFVYIIGNKY